MIRFSVITCTYNAAQDVRRTLDSVARQDYPHVEHLLIDGLSTDGTIDLIERYAKSDGQTAGCHQVKMLSEPDEGLYDAMNKGLRLATGDYVLFLNAGDTFPSRTTLQQVARSVEESGGQPGVLYGDTDIVDGEGVVVRHRHLSVPEKLSWRSFRRGMLVCHQAFYARRDVAQANPYDLHYRFSADVDWCIKVMKECERRRLPLLNLHGVVCHYLDGGMTIKNHRASLRERFEVMRDHYGLFSTLLMHVWFMLRGCWSKVKSI